MKKFRVIPFHKPWHWRLWHWIRRDPYEWVTLPEAIFRAPMLEQKGYIGAVVFKFGDDTPADFSNDPMVYDWPDDPK